MMLPIARIINKAECEQITRIKLSDEEWDKVKESLLDTSMEDNLIWQLTDLVTNVDENRNKVMVASSLGDIWCDFNGNVLETTNTDHFKYKQFNFAECDVFWGNTKRQSVYNILDLSGVHSDGTCFAPDYGARNDMLLKCPKWLTLNIKFGKGE
jgi:hypothetical protein